MSNEEKVDRFVLKFKKFSRLKMPIDGKQIKFKVSLALQIKFKVILDFASNLKQIKFRIMPSM